MPITTATKAASELIVASRDRRAVVSSGSSSQSAPLAEITAVASALLTLPPVTETGPMRVANGPTITMMMAVSSSMSATAPSSQMRDQRRRGGRLTRSSSRESRLGNGDPLKIRDGQHHHRSRVHISASKALGDSTLSSACCSRTSYHGGLRRRPVRSSNTCRCLRLMWNPTRSSTAIGASDGTTARTSRSDRLSTRR